MKPLWMCALVLAVHLDASHAQKSVTDFQQKSGALVFRDGTDKIVGIEIPGYGSGFERSIVIDDAMKQWFDSSKPDLANDAIALRVPFADAPDRLTGLTKFPDLKWIIYKGGRFWPPQPVKSRNNEEGRISVVIDAMEGLAELQGVLIYDATLPTGGLERIVSLERLKAIALINCELKTRGGYARLPDLKMIRTQEHEELHVTIRDRTKR